MDKWVLFFRISLALVSWTFSKFCPFTSKICTEKMSKDDSLFQTDVRSISGHMLVEGRAASTNQQMQKKNKL